jgi:hypothetical protein
MTLASYSDVLKAAHRLPPDAQAELAATLLRNLKPRSRAKKQAQTTGLEPLRGMSVAELSVLAEAVIAPGQQQTLHELLEMNRSGALTPDDETMLDDLLAQVDQVGLLKARARYTLSLGAGPMEIPQ